jgi:4-aminobutyrate aminotransferase
MDILKKDKELISKSWAFKYYPLIIERAKGSKVWDMEGKEYIDFLSSAAVYNIGHSNEEVVLAIKEQLEKFMNYTPAYLYIEPPVKLAEKLIGATPGSFKKKVYFGFSGSDAVDSAIKFARAHKNKRKIISFRGSYHGVTYGALSATGIFSNSQKKTVFSPPGFKFFPYADCFRCPYHLDYPECGIECATAVEKGIEDACAMLVEPIQGDAGVIVPPMEFFTELKRTCEERGVLLIDDEVQTGMGRTGKMWAIEHYRVIPDMLITAKALGGGMPISAVVGKDSILDSLQPPLGALTHGGHAICASAAIAALDFTLRERLWDRARELGSYSIKRLEEMKGKNPNIGQVRGKGLLIGVDVVKKGKTPNKKLALKICYSAWKKGLLMITFGENGNVLRIAPTLTIEKNELDKGLDILEEALNDAKSGKVTDEEIENITVW